MSKPSKKKSEKKRKHEEEDRKKLLSRRARLRAEKSEDKAKWRLEKATRVRIKPYSHPKPHAKTAEEIARQLEENLQALKALEEQYEREVAEREGLNKALEEEGFKTLREKLDYLNEEAMKNVEEAKKENAKLKRKNRRANDK
jgi:hypothetical protein